jgi:AcrR family transcriptional regulator
MPQQPSATDPRTVRSRDALRRALLELLETTPFEQITIRDICARAEIGYTTYFRHHPTRESLLDDVAAEEINRLVRLTLPVMDAGSALAGCVALFRYVDEHRAVWATLLTGGAAAALRAELLRLALREAAARAPRGTWRQAEVSTRLIVSGTIEVLSWWLKLDEPVPLKDAAKILTTMVIKPAVKGAAAAPQAWRKPAKKAARK